MVFRAGGEHEPNVELLGEDAPELVTTPTAERARTWWPLWAVGGALLLMAVLALVRSGGTSDGPVADDAPVSVETEPPPSSAAPTTVAATQQDAGGSNAIRETWPSTDATSTGDGAENGSATIDNAQAVSELGLTGHLYAWNVTALYRLDLATGTWDTLDTDVQWADPWIRRMEATPTGFVLSGQGTILSADVDGNEIERLSTDVIPAGIAQAAGTTWVVSSFNPDDNMELSALQPDGTWRDGPSITSTFAFGPMRLVGSGDRLLVSPFSGGIFDVLDQNRRLSNGYVIAGNADELIVFGCPDSLDDCAFQRMDATSLEPHADPIQGRELSGVLWSAAPTGWSPDLRYYFEPWGSGRVQDTLTGEVTYIQSRASDQTFPTWTAGSEYLVSVFGATIRFYDPASGDHVAVAPPTDDLARWNATFLHRP